MVIGCQENPQDNPQASADDMGAAADAAPDEGSGDDRPDAALDRGLPPDLALPPLEPDMATGPTDCDPALAIEPASGFIGALDLLTLTGSGGTGSYRFELIENNSGAILNPVTGAYVAGEVSSVTDLVRMTDTGCLGEAMADVAVVEPVELRPSQIEVPPSQVVRFDGLGGSGAFEFSLRVNNTGADLSPQGIYTAGPTLGRDVVEARDPGTGLVGEAVVTVSANPILAAEPAQMYLTVGSTLPIRFGGGSSWFDIEQSGQSADFDQVQQTVTGLAPGRTTFNLTDRYTRQRLEYVVDVAGPLEADLVRAGRNLVASAVHGPGDIDGDGWADAIVGMPESTIEAFSDGAVYVYRGGPQGLNSEPAQVLHGAARSDEFGRAVTTADLDGDGHLELIVGSWLDDAAGGDRGAVYVYPGLPEGFFGDAPSRVLYGPRGGDRLGLSLAICDFNGDRFLDIAAGAWLADYIPEEGDRRNDTGAVMVFLGSESGFRDAPDGGILYGGSINEEGDWTYRQGYRLGLAMDAGDIDGDGLCDLATSTLNSGGNHGAVHVYRGRAPEVYEDTIDLGGLDPLPARIYAGAGGNQLGRRLAVADLNGDLRADVIAGQHLYDGPGLANAGAIRVFSGGPLAGPVRQLTPEAEHDWLWSGDTANDNAGSAIATGDWNGDGQVDLLIGSWADERPIDEPVPDTGSVAVLLGQRGAWPDAAPTFRAYGPEAGGRFGESVAMLGDVTGDGIADLATLAGADPSLGIRVGRPFFVGGDGLPPRGLLMPGDASGAWNGWAAAAVGDVDRDGLSDLVVGAPDAARAPNVLLTGRVFLYRGVEGGYDPSPAAVLEGHFDHTANDRFGYAMAGGDFDGDRAPDIFIGATGEERPNSFDPEQFEVIGDCAGRQNDQSAVYIYRGREGGPDPARPDYIYYGFRGGADLRSILVADMNDDGRQDLIVGGMLWDNPDQQGNDQGAIEIVYGRAPSDDGRTVVLCDVAYRWFGPVGGARAGKALALMGDVDRDGCNDVAIGAYNTNVDRSPAAGDETPQGGSVHVLFGWNRDGCAVQPRMVSLAGGGNRPQAGWSLATGNLIGDPRPDLAIGAINHTFRGNERSGAVYVVDGAWLAELEPEEANVDRPTYHPLGPADDQVVLLGSVPGEQYGYALEVVGGRLFVTRPVGVVGEQRAIGGAEVYVFDQGVPRRVAQLSGETWRSGGRMGDAIISDRTRPLLTIGGRQASGLGTESGAAYTHDLSALR